MSKKTGRRGRRWKERINFLPHPSPCPLLLRTLSQFRSLCVLLEMNAWLQKLIAELVEVEMARFTRQLICFSGSISNLTVCCCSSFFINSSNGLGKTRYAKYMTQHMLLYFQSGKLDVYFETEEKIMSKATLVSNYFCPMATINK